MCIDLLYYVLVRGGLNLKLEGVTIEKCDQATLTHWKLAGTPSPPLQIHPGPPCARKSR